MTSRVVFLSPAAATVAAFAFAGALIAGAGSAQATPAFAQQTKQGCPACHVMPPNKDKLTPTGQKFKANGYKM